MTVLSNDNFGLSDTVAPVLAQPQVPTESDRFPFIESRALKAKLTGIRVSATNYSDGREVPVHFVAPDFEFVKASYPGIYLDYGMVTRATDREHRGSVNLEYAPPGFLTSVAVPEDMEDKDNLNTVDWGASGFDPVSSPYFVADAPVPYNLDFDIAVLTRNYQQTFSIISQLQDIEKIPERFGFLEVPEDGTVRTLELVSGPDTSVITDEDSKRLVQTLYSVRVAAELSLYDIEQVNRVATVNISEIERI